MSALGSFFGMYSSGLSMKAGSSAGLGSWMAARTFLYKAVNVVFAGFTVESA